MRVLAVVIVGLLLAGCDHMYGAVDGGRLSDSLAIQLARQEAVKRDISLKGLEPAVARFDTGTGISFDLPGCADGSCLDGGPYFFIDAGKRRISYVRKAY